jgi:hypothetical protein
MLTAVAKELQDPDKGVQQLLANLNSISDRIDRGEGAIGRLLTEDKLVRDLEALVARMSLIFDDLKRFKTFRNSPKNSMSKPVISRKLPAISKGPWRPWKW